MKGITPIISVIVLLLIAVALAGAAWTYIGGFMGAYTTKVIDLPPGSSYFDGKNVKIMLRNIGTSAISTGSCTTSGNTVTCGDITITREGSSNNADIRPSASSISPKGSVTITDYACESGNVKYRISSPSSTYQLDVSADIPCSFPTDPVSWWKFDGDAKDSVGSNHGTPSGGVSWANDAARGQVAGFDGVDDYVDCGNDSALISPPALTLSAWIKTAYTQKRIIDAWQSGAVNYLFYTQGNRIRFYLNAGGSPVTTVSSVSVIDNIWHHVVGIWDGSIMKVYVDGIQSGTPATTTGDLVGSGNNLFIGGGPNEPFNGLIDDVMIFKRALSPEEIKAIYNSQKK